MGVGKAEAEVMLGVEDIGAGPANVPEIRTEVATDRIEHSLLVPVSPQEIV
jgi:hypothetical protein